MGNTCASFHVVMHGPREVILPKVIQAVSRAYTAIGYERSQKHVSGGKHIVLMAPDGQRFASIFDSTNAQMDDGELKDVALKATKSLMTAAAFTSIYDSDSYEFILFSNGRQVDCLMDGDETNDSISKQMKPVARSKNWSSYFVRPITSEEITSAALRNSAFADDNISALSQLIGLSKGQSQLQYQDVRDDTAAHIKHLFFKRKEQILAKVVDGQQSFSQFYDPFYSRMISVYPASWPAKLATEISPTWLVLSDGAGFTDARAVLTVEGPEGLSLQQIFVNGCKFHNGQIVGPLESTPPPPPAMTEDETKAYAQAITDAKKFAFTAIDGGTSPVRK